MLSPIVEVTVTRRNKFENVEVTSAFKVAKPINTIIVFEESKYPMPYRFRYVDDKGTAQDVYVDKFINIEEKKIAGIRTINYSCQSRIGGRDIRYELKYVIDDPRWELYKM